jgi:uncharacterized OsmC-like protein
MATNAAGAQVRLGSGVAGVLSPVELLLAAIAGCTAVDIDTVTSRRAEPTRFRLTTTATKERSANGNILRDIDLHIEVTFADDEPGRAAAAMVPRTARISHDRTCTVSRTIEAGTPVSIRLVTDKPPPDDTLA